MPTRVIDLCPEHFSDCFVKLLSTHIHLYPYICAALNLGQSHFLLVWVVANKELYKLVEMLRISD